MWTRCSIRILGSYWPRGGGTRARFSRSTVVTGADQIEISGKSNLLQKSDYGTVWVLHDPEPPANKAAVEYSSADDVEWLMPPRLKKKE